jgi:hypothetical protein
MRHQPKRGRAEAGEEQPAKQPARAEQQVSTAREQQATLQPSKSMKPTFQRVPLAKNNGAVAATAKAAPAAVASGKENAEVRQQPAAKPAPQPREVVVINSDARKEPSGDHHSGLQATRRTRGGRAAVAIAATGAAVRRTRVAAALVAAATIVAAAACSNDLDSEAARPAAAAAPAKGTRKANRQGAVRRKSGSSLGGKDASVEDEAPTCSTSGSEEATDELPRSLRWSPARRWSSARTNATHAACAGSEPGGGGEAGPSRPKKKRRRTLPGMGGKQGMCAARKQGRLVQRAAKKQRSKPTHIAHEASCAPCTLLQALKPRLALRRPSPCGSAARTRRPRGTTCR